MSDLHADEGQLRAFVDAIFRYATDGTFISLRGFSQFNRASPPICLRPLKVNGSLDAMLVQVTAAAEDCAQTVEPSVFAPPICTFTNPYHAALADLANGLTLSVDIDHVDPEAARGRLEGLLGPATVIVQSGSDWTDPTTGEVKPNLHLHWRLSEPTTTPAEHEALRQARTIAATLIGADPSGSSIVHPLRWPGSWHRKATPRLATATVNEAAEINLVTALDALEGAMEAEGRARAEMPASGTPEAPLRFVASAVAAIPNPATDVPYDQWIRIGYAIHRATGGSPDGADLWDQWSAKSSKYVAAETAATWRRIGNATAGKAPPRTIGAGTLFYLADRAGWVRPFLFSARDDARGAFGASGDADADWFARQGKDGEKPRDKKSIRILSMAEIDALPPPKWLIHKLIPEKSLTFVYGPPKAGKTFIVLSMALHVAAGRPWFGRAVQQGAVVYISGEGTGGLGNRLRALRAYHDIPIEAPFWTIDHAVNFRSPDNIREMVDAIRMTVGNNPVAMVVVDTLARAMPGGDENSAQDTGLVIQAMDWVRDELGCACLPIHHQGKDADRGARGTSALRGAWDAAFQITGTGKAVTFTVADQKEAEAGEVIHFEMIDQMTSLSESSLVPVLADESADEKIRPGPGGNTGLLYNVVIDLMASPDSAIIPPHPDIPPGVRGIGVDRVRQMFDERMPAETPDARRMAFKRSLTGLQERRLIGVKAPWVWLV